MPANLVVTQLEPHEVDAVFSGSQRSFYFLNANEIKLVVKLFGAHKGTNQKALSRINFTFPEGLTLENVDPKEVKVHLQNAATEPNEGN